MLANSARRLDPQLAIWALCGMNLLFLVLLLKTRKKTQT